MPNGFFFSLMLQDGTPLEVNFGGNDGVILRNEFDASPRLTELQFMPADPVTEHRVAEVRRNNGWKSYEFHLLPFANSSGLLGFKEVAAGCLPAGSYFTRLTIEDVKLPKRPIKFKISDNTPTVIKLPVVEDPRRIELFKDIEHYDVPIGRIVTNRMSRLETADIKTWLGDSTRRTRRKACLLNVLAKLRAADDYFGVGITQTIQHVFFADVDRIYVATTNRLLQLLQGRFKPGGPIHPTHMQLRKFAKMKHPNLELGPMNNFREGENPSLQIVTCAAVDAEGKIIGQYADVDIDLGNPEVDLVGLIVHAGELINRGRTDHLKLWTRLTKNPAVAKYLPYRPPSHA
jgi:hypothetical protein